MILRLDDHNLIIIVYLYGFRQKVLYTFALQKRILPHLKEGIREWY